MSLTFKQATRQGVIPLIDLYSESGCGKTYSALLLARGIAGPAGKIGMIDTETGRGSLYADVIPGGYTVLDLDAPFGPAKFIEALNALYASGAAVGVVDSMSHEWEGIGGVCDLADKNEHDSGKPGLHNWRSPKLEHQKLVQHLLRSPIPIICCIRAKYKTRQKRENGKTIIVRDEVTSPIQAEDFIFEATAHAEILPDHSINLTKCSHPELRKCFPEKGPITSEHGKLIAAWCGTSAPKPAKSETESLQLVLWNALKSVRKPGGKGWAEVDAWLVSRFILKAGQSVVGLNADELRVTIEKAEIELTGAVA